MNRLATVLLAVPIAAVVTACSGGAASPASSTPGSAAGGADVLQGAPAIAPGSVGATGASGSGVATNGISIAYPYPIISGSSGLAPDHELVVTGTGTATMKADGSDKGAAEKKAIEAAMADARAQAETAASAASVTLGGVVSVSVSLNDYGYAVPMAAGSGSASGSTGSAGSSAPGTPVPVPPTVVNGGTQTSPVEPPAPSQTELGVTITVAFSIS